MIIGACGFCATGSSAICDYLKEFEENQVLDNFEFTFSYLPDGLEDLGYHLMENVCRDDSSSIAIPRFRRFMKKYERGLERSGVSKAEQKKMIEAFLDDLIQFKWRSSRRSDVLLYPSNLYKFFGQKIMRGKVIPFINKRIGRCVDLYPYREIEVSIAPQCFPERSKAFINEILIAMGADTTKNIVLDQPFIGEDPERSFKFFNKPKAIIVDRDPRDNYLFVKTYLYKRTNMMPSNNVQDFVKYYRLLRENRPYLKDTPKILRVQFEDLIYNYEETTRKIRIFCNLPENKKPFTFFNPSLSIHNTQLIRKFPQYQKDIEYIEKTLPEYLFDFSPYPEPQKSGKMFDKSNLG